MTIPPLAFKIATQLIQERLKHAVTAPQEQALPQATETADIPRDGQVPWQGTALSLLGGRNPSATATEPAPKVVTDTGKQS